MSSCVVKAVQDGLLTYGLRYNSVFGIDALKLGKVNIRLVLLRQQNWLTDIETVVCSRNICFIRMLCREARERERESTHMNTSIVIPEERIPYNNGRGQPLRHSRC